MLFFKKTPINILVSHAVLAMTSLGVVLFASTAHANTGSEYTSLKLKDCKKSNEEPYFLATCPSKAGYKLEVVGADLRTGADVSYQGHKVSYQPVAPFSVGDVAEWRYSKKSGKKNYHSIIYRVRTAKMADDDSGTFLPREKDKQEMVVIRLAQEKSCVIGVVPQSKDMNAHARKIADSNTMQCVELPF